MRSSTARLVCLLGPILLAVSRPNAASAQEAGGIYVYAWTTVVVPHDRAD